MKRASAWLRPDAIAALVVVALGLGWSSRAAFAQSEVERGEPREVYWTTGLSAALVEPVGSLTQTHMSGLAAELRLSRNGPGRLGVQACLRYTPMPHVREAGVDIESHLTWLTLAPRYALLWRSLRLWGAAGAGALLERTTRTVGDAASAETAFAITLQASAGLDWRAFGRGGPSLSTSWGRNVAGDSYSLYTLSIGLAFEL